MIKKQPTMWESKVYYKTGVSYDDLLLEGPERLVPLVEAVAEIAPFAPWLNWAAKQLWDDLWVLGQEDLQVASVEDMHLLLTGAVIKYLRIIGHISVEQEVAAYGILC